jgi:hypothetical protein
LPAIIGVYDFTLISKITQALAPTKDEYEHEIPQQVVVWLISEAQLPLLESAKCMQQLGWAENLQCTRFREQMLQNS